MQQKESSNSNAASIKMEGEKREKEKKLNQYRNHATKTIQHIKKKMKKKRNLIQVSIKTRSKSQMGSHKTE